MKRYIHIAIILLATLTTGCEKLIEVDSPSNQLTKDKVFSDESSTEAALLNSYAQFVNTIDGSLNILLPLYSDDLIYQGSTPAYIEFNQSLIAVDNTFNSSIWNAFYSVIYACNDILEQVPAADGIPEPSKTNFLSEARFLRAYAFFYLQNLYGNIPLPLSTDINRNRVMGQSQESQVYGQMEADLLEAEAGFNATQSSLNKSRANLWAAKALLARIYLYQERWDEAASKATEVIESGVFGLETPEVTFYDNSMETVMNFWTQNGIVSVTNSFFPGNFSAVPQFMVSGELLNAFSVTDVRKDTWVGASEANGDTYYFPFKYRNAAANAGTPEYLVALRLAEQYLIRAEARAMLDNAEGSTADINALRLRANTEMREVVADRSSLIHTVLTERRLELFTEWSHRFFDLKRRSVANDVLGPIKSTWRQNTSLNLPIPQSEISYNPSLVQNEGY